MVLLVESCKDVSHVDLILERAVNEQETWFSTKSCEASGFIERDCRWIGGVDTKSHLVKAAHACRVAQKPVEQLSTDTALAKTGIDVHSPYHGDVCAFESVLTMENSSTDEALTFESAEHDGITGRQSLSYLCDRRFALLFVARRECSRAFLQRLQAKGLALLGIARNENANFLGHLTLPLR